MLLTAESWSQLKFLSTHIRQVHQLSYFFHIHQYPRNFGYVNWRHRTENIPPVVAVLDWSQLWTLKPRKYVVSKNTLKVIVHYKACLWGVYIGIKT